MLDETAMKREKMMVVIGTLITCIVAIICYRQVRKIDKLASRIYMLYTSLICTATLLELVLISRISN